MTQEEYLKMFADMMLAPIAKVNQVGRAIDQISNKKIHGIVARNILGMEVNIAVGRLDSPMLSLGSGGIESGITPCDQCPDVTLYSILADGNYMSQRVTSAYLLQFTEDSGSGVVRYDPIIVLDRIKEGSWNDGRDN